MPSSTASPDLTAPRLLETIRKIEARPAFDIARRMRSVCEQIFAYGIGTGKADRNIAADLKGTLEAFKRGHFKAISRCVISVHKPMRIDENYQFDQLSIS